MLNDEGLNPEPTDVQRATLRRHQKAGTSPGNPKWYRSPAVKPFTFTPGLPPKYPRLPTGAQSHARRYGVSKVTTRYADGTSLTRLVGKR